MENEIVTVKNNEIVIANDFMEKYLILQEAVKQFKEMDKQLKEVLKEKMLENDIKWIKTDDYKITLKSGGYRKIADTQKLKDEKWFDYFSKEVGYDASVTIQPIGEEEEE